jgi:hypothetical protein
LDTYRIVRAGENWSLRLNGDQMAVFPDQGLASRAANVAARMSRSRGRLAEVHVDDTPHDPSVILIDAGRSTQVEGRNGEPTPDGADPTRQPQRIGTTNDLSFARAHLV